MSPLADIVKTAERLQWTPDVSVGRLAYVVSQEEWDYLLDLFDWGRQEMRELTICGLRVVKASP